jgi:hypothetical protein
MQNAWRLVVGWLAALSADPVAVEVEHPRAAAAVAAAYASFATDAPPAPPAPPSAGCGCGGACEKGIYRPDGKISMPCERDCACKCRLSAEGE